jgi:CubicO group peptidase (beta-lactamase class C family)
MGELHDLLESAGVPGAAALVGRRDELEIASVGDAGPDSIFRIASLTKPITAAAVMLLVDDGVVALGDPIARWLPELESPWVVRTPGSPIDDLVPAARPITVEDLLTFRAGWGFPSDFSLPAVGELLRKLPLFGVKETPEEWLVTLAGIPMLNQPGEVWLYNTCSDIQGVLVARASGRSLPDLLAERIFEPLGMADTAFHVPAAKHAWLAPYHGSFDGALWNEPRVFASGAGGLVSTLADWNQFGRMLLAGGEGLLSRESVRLLMTDHLTAGERAASTLFLEGAGWGFGGSVAADGRYGWVGGTGTAAHVSPATGTVGILLTQVQMAGPTSTPLMRRFWEHAFGETS